MKIYPDTKVYVLCPASVASGGPELLHQLASQLVKTDIDAYMFYTPPNDANPVHANYVKYQLPFVRELEDEPHNVLILPETCGENVHVYERIQRVFWWLSVDNYVNTVVDAFNSYRNVNLLAPMPRPYMFRGTGDESIEHWVQSEYARQFIAINGLEESRIKRVGDYLNPIFLTRASSTDLSAKQDIVAFYPGKGLEFTRKLIAAAPELKWVPIMNMTLEQVQETLARAKVYIDFGHHPGRDRIPREAAVSRCVVMTGRRGSAANPIDVAIDDSFKFDNTDESVPRIIERIKEVFADYASELEKQEAYRAEIMSEPERFAREVREACEFTEPLKVRKRVAILQNIIDEKNLSAFNEIMRDMPHLKLSFIVDDAISRETGGGGWYRLQDSLIRSIGNSKLFEAQLPTDHHVGGRGVPVQREAH